MNNKLELIVDGTRIHLIRELHADCIKNVDATIEIRAKKTPRSEQGLNQIYDLLKTELDKLYGGEGNYKYNIQLKINLTKINNDSK